MKRQPSGLDLNPIKNSWSLVKIKFYEGGKQYSSKTDLWKASKTIIWETEPAEVQKNKTKQDKKKTQQKKTKQTKTKQKTKPLPKSMDNKFLAVIENKGLYIEM